MLTFVKWHLRDCRRASLPSEVRLSTYLTRIRTLLEFIEQPRFDLIESKRHENEAAMSPIYWYWIDNFFLDVLNTNKEILFEVPAGQHFWELQELNGFSVLAFRETQEFCQPKQSSVADNISKKFHDPGNFIASCLPRNHNVAMRALFRLESTN